MSSTAERRRLAKAFNEVADEYDAHRPTYPDVLIDRACEAANLDSGDPVLEIGCGTGQLTQALLARGLRVTAIEPGAQLIARARARLAGAADVRFVNARLEDAALAPSRFRAVFSASAIHWIDPDVGWRIAAETLVDRGTLALISYFGLQDARSAADQRALRESIARVTPDLAIGWPTYHDLDQTLAGATARRSNISDVWSWLGSYEIAREYAARLYGDADIETVPTPVEHTGGQLTSLLATMSFWSRLSPDQREALGVANDELYRRLGRPIRASTVACLVTAQPTRESSLAAPG
jgi:SAM-dependent methyltransferase